MGNILKPEIVVPPWSGHPADRSPQKLSRGCMASAYNMSSICPGLPRATTCLGIRYPPLTGLRPWDAQSFACRYESCSKALGPAFPLFPRVGTSC